MSSTERLLKATLNRLGARIGQKIIDSAAQLAEIANDAPDKLRNEWESFQKEVIEEAERLEKRSSEEDLSNYSQEADNSAIDEPEAKIDLIRAKVAELNQKLEAKS